MRDKGIEPLVSTWKEDMLAITSISQFEVTFTSLVLLYIFKNFFQIKMVDLSEIKSGPDGSRTHLKNNLLLTFKHAYILVIYS